MKKYALETFKGLLKTSLVTYALLVVICMIGSFRDPRFNFVYLWDNHLVALMFLFNTCVCVTIGEVIREYFRK